MYVSWKKMCMVYTYYEQFSLLDDVFDGVVGYISV